MEEAGLVVAGVVGVGAGEVEHIPSLGYDVVGVGNAGAEGRSSG